MFRIAIRWTNSTRRRWGQLDGVGIPPVSSHAVKLSFEKAISQFQSFGVSLRWFMTLLWTPCGGLVEVAELIVLTLFALTHTTDVESRSKNHREQDKDGDKDHERVPYLL